MAERKLNQPFKYDDDVVNLGVAKSFYLTRGLIYGALPLAISKTALLSGIFTPAELGVIAFGTSVFPVVDLLGAGYFALYQGVSDLITNVNNRALGYKAKQLVYKGNSLQIGEKEELTRGDNFLYVSLPKIVNKGKSSDSQPGFAVRANLQQRLWDQAIKNIATELPSRDIKAICVETPLPTQQSSKQPTVTVERLFPLVATKNKERVLTIFTPAEFRSLQFSEDDLRKKAVELLKDKHLPGLINKLDNARSLNESLQAKAQILRRIRIIISEHIERKQVSNQVIRELTGQNYTPIRKKITTWTDIKADRKGKLHALTFSQDGNSKKTPVEKVVDAQGKSLKDIVQDENSTSAQIAYGLYLSIHDLDVSKFDQKNVEALSKDVLDSINQAGLKVGRNRWSMDSIIDHRRTYQRVFQVLGSRAFPLIFAASMLLATKPLFHLGRLLADQIKDQQKYTVEQPVHAINFPDKLPDSSLEWKVVASEGLNTDGYYITRTSNRVDSNGSWAEFNRRKDYILYPTSINEDIKSIELQKRIPADFMFGQGIKIPVKDKTVLAAIKVTSDKGEEVPSPVYILEDGTVELVLKSGLVDGVKWVDIKATLVPVDDPQVKATSKVSIIDQSKLSEVATAQIERIKEHQTDGKSLTQATIDYIRDNYIYSIASEHRRSLFNVRTAESKVNNIAHLDYCSCSVCNSHAMLLSTLDTESEDFLNMAFGFLKGIELTGNKSGYLKKEASHAFLISASKAVLDSTPTNVSDDPLTQQYLELLKGVDDDSAWEKMLNNIEETQNSHFYARVLDIQKTQSPENFKELLKSLGTVFVLGGVSSFILGRTLGALSFKVNNLLSKDFEKPIREDYLRFYTTDELMRAYDLLSRFSYGNGSFTPGTSKISLSRDQLTKAILEDMNGDRVKDLANSLEPKFTRSELLRGYNQKRVATVGNLGGLFKSWEDLSKVQSIAKFVSSSSGRKFVYLAGQYLK